MSKRAPITPKDYDKVRVLACAGLDPDTITHITGLQLAVVNDMRASLFPHDAAVAHGSLPSATTQALDHQDRPDPPRPSWHGALRAALHRGPRAPWHRWP